MIFVLPLEWLTWKKKDVNFEHYEDNILAQTLREFFASVRTKNGKIYSRSSMINLRAGLNRYLRSPPHNRIINLMQNEVFQNATQVFKGKLRKNKQEGHDNSAPRTEISQEDLQKLNHEYFIQGLENGNMEVLLHKVFFDFMYHTGRRGKKGLRSLTKKSFDVKKGADGVEFIEINFNEVTKKNQGDALSSGLDSLHNNHAIITAQEGNILDPVTRFKHYLSNLSEHTTAFFQYPDPSKTVFTSKHVSRSYICKLQHYISTTKIMLTSF